MLSAFTSVDDTANGTVLNLPEDGNPVSELVISVDGSTGGVCIGPQGSNLVYTAAGSAPSAGEYGWLIPDGGTLELTLSQAGADLAAICDTGDSAVVVVLAKGAPAT